jgi:hypothetical protein
VLLLGRETKKGIAALLSSATGKLKRYLNIEHAATVTAIARGSPGLQRRIEPQALDAA